MSMPQARPRRLAALRRAMSVLALLGTAPALGGCDWSLMNPKGPIGADERSLILFSTGLMLIVVIPVILMALGFAWRFRATNTKADYRPDWEHSSRIEAVVWLVPCAIILVLGIVTWRSSHRLDPYRAIAAATKPIEVQVVSLDWKWLFIYPDLNVASVNELAMPVGTPVHFDLTSSGVMNSFFVPQLGSQVYTMAGMQTQLSLLASSAGDYQGVSANFSGDGFSDMQFTAKALSQPDFDAWVQKARASKQALTMSVYRDLAQPSERVPVSYFGTVQPTVFHDVLNKCADGSTCTDSAMRETTTKEALGGTTPLCPPTKPEGL